MSRVLAMVSAALLVAAPAAAQPLFEIEGGGGFTFVDVEGIAVADGAIANDWSQPNYRFAVRALVGRVGGLRVGAEVGHQFLYWYQVRIPFGSTPITREYDVSATSAMALLRLGGGSSVVDLGAGMAFLDDPVGLLSVAVGWEVAPRVSIKLRADGMFASEPTVPVGLGLSYAFGARAP